MRIALLGLGLIGGSLARALRARAVESELVAWSPAGRGPRAALADGTVDAAAQTVADAVDGADVVVLAAPPLACLGLLDELAHAARPALGRETVITDVASTKRRIIERAAMHRLPFVGGHPMAGRELTGFGAADADLFLGRPWVVCGEGDQAVVVDDLARRVGAIPVRMDAATHDAAVASISHLPLVVSAALVEAVAGDAGAEHADWPAARALAAGGWRDMSRLALGDAEMGAGIAATNADLLVERIRRLRRVLGDWEQELTHLEDGDAGRVLERLQQARATLERGTDG
jgi:prephenate dehydrogenase